ncbi:hypothetical protein WAI453_001483 [Rhynchosporium graminicola]
MLRINAIIISWFEDDLEIDSELDELQTTFQSLNFSSVGKFYIPSIRSFNALSEVLRIQKQKAAAEDALLVVYYGGHGRLGSNSISASLDWNSMQASLEYADIDVFLILDCCNASAAAASFEIDPEDYPDTTSRFEILAGCGYDAVTRGAGRYSFTAALTAELKKQCKREKVFSVAQLYQWLHAKMLRQHPSNIPDSADEEYDKCFVAPTYIPRCMDHNHVSIPLRKMEEKSCGNDGSGTFDEVGFLNRFWEPEPLEEMTSSNSDCSTPRTEHLFQTSIGSWSECGYVWSPIKAIEGGETKAACFQRLTSNEQGNFGSVESLAENLRRSHIEEGVGVGPIGW